MTPTQPNAAAPAGSAPATLDAAGIRARIPHQGRMALLDTLLDWSDGHVRCTIANHTAADHPLRSHSGLLAPCAVEFAGQAMALHAALRSAAAEAAANGSSAASEPRAGFLASVRGLTLHRPRLDDAAGPLVVRADRIAGDQRQAIYGFELRDAAGTLLVDGRCTVVLDGSPAAAV